VLSMNPRPGEEFCVFSEPSLAQASRARLSEMMYCSYCFTLAQARWASLSEADGLAWAKVLALSECAMYPMLVCAVWDWLIVNSQIRGIICVCVMWLDLKD